MPSLYLLSCSCGKSVSVALRQAGETVQCECGETLNVPSLRGLRQLPVETIEAEAQASWGARKGFMTFSLAMVIVSGAAGGALWLASDSVAPMSEQEYREEYRQMLETATPAETYYYWTRGIRDPLLYYNEESDYAKQAAEAKVLRQIAYSGWIVSALFAIGMIIAFFLPAVATRPSRSPQTPLSHS
jgi:hypothetical protein